jgi:hypothetical protein
MKLNLGCGFNKKPSWLNVDNDPTCKPDLLFDLETFPWPLEDNAATEIELNHVLEHLGQDSQTYLSIICELYRIASHDARIRILVPHPRHDSFLCDPTHVRPILAESFQLFSKSLNREWRNTGKSNTLLALRLDVDFEITKVNHDLESSWTDQLNNGDLSQPDLQKAISMYSNVIKQTTIELKVRKTSSS